MYDIIKQTPPVREKYAAQLAARPVTAEAAKAEADAAYAKLTEVQQALRRGARARPAKSGASCEPPWRSPRRRRCRVLTRVNEALLAVPDGFTVHPKLKRS